MAEDPTGPAGEIDILWEYLVKSEYLERFIQAYSMDGDWALLFSKYQGYIGTTLLRDSANPARFITVDRWRSPACYAEMKSRSRQDYRDLDERCEIYTSSEHYIGVFDRHR